MKPRVSLALLLPSLWFFATCHDDELVAPLAIRSAETKTPAAGQTDLARHASTTFREALYAARYESLPDVRRLLTASYLENPSDPEVALLLGHAHLWTLSERSRVGDAVGPEITDHALLAEHYFGEASALAPEDDRIPGWQGGARLAIGDIHDDQRATRRGYFQLREAVRAYPAFNGFSAGFVLSSQDRDSDRFAEAVELFWTNLAACAGDDRIREDHRLQRGRIFGVCQRVTGLNVLHTDHGDDVTCLRTVDILTGVRMHLHQTANSLGLASEGVKDRVALAERARINTGKGQCTITVVHDLECQRA